MATPRGKWTVAQAAKEWKVTHATILRWIRSGRLPPDTVERVEETRGVVYFIKVQKRPAFGDSAFAPIPFIPRKGEEEQSVAEAAPEEQPEAEAFDYGDDVGQYEVTEEPEEDEDIPAPRRRAPEGPSMEELEAIEEEEQKPAKRRRIVR